VLNIYPAVWSRGSYPHDQLPRSPKIVYLWALAPPRLLTPCVTARIHPLPQSSSVFQLASQPAKLSSEFPNACLCGKAFGIGTPPGIISSHPDRYFAHFPARQTPHRDLWGRVVGKVLCLRQYSNGFFRFSYK